jgi:ribonuclease Z
LPEDSSELSNFCSVLLDAGEGAAAQLFQSVGGDIDRFDAKLLAIAVIWISHQHADHICGFLNLVENIQRARWRAERRVGTSASTKKSSDRNFRPNILVITPPTVAEYFQFAVNVAGLDEIISFQPVSVSLFVGMTDMIMNYTHGQVLKLISVPVFHCRESYGVVLELRGGAKVVFSGDCRPSQSLINAGKYCDVLIHEATFGDDLQEDAIAKRHCTTSEALQVSASMRVRGLTILTHFSQRYPRISQTNRFESSSDSKPISSVLVQPFAVASDFLRFSYPSQCHALPKITSAFAEYLSSVEQVSQSPSFISL